MNKILAIAMLVATPAAAQDYSELVEASANLQGLAIVCEGVYPKQYKISINKLVEVGYPIVVDAGKNTGLPTSYWVDQFNIEIMDSVKFWAQHRDQIHPLCEDLVNSKVLKGGFYRLGSTT